MKAMPHRLSRTVIIYHPYGVVADLPLPASRIFAVPFGGNPSSHHNYAALSAGIKIFTEQMAAAEMLSQIHDEMFRAEQVVFLGFAYHDPNMAILTPEGKYPQKDVYGTAKDMSEISIRWIRNQLSGMFSGCSPEITDRTSAALFALLCQSTHGLEFGRRDNLQIIEQ